ncbi:MAG: galactose mutarotase, partial [Erysipelotrichaceae bacterium]
QLEIFSTRITEIDENLTPTGYYIDVKDTPFDFRIGKLIGKDINCDDEQLKFGNGFDHNFVIDNDIAAILSCDNLRMIVRTSLPGMQVYTGNYLNEYTNKDGFTFKMHGGVALETQSFPDAINHDNFPNVVLNKGEKYHSETSYNFEVIK